MKSNFFKGTGLGLRRYCHSYIPCLAVLILAAGASAQSSPPCDPAPAGLIGWWPADGNADDIVGANNGTLENGVTFAPGEVGEAFSFNGDYQYVQIPDSPSLHPVSVTLECWFNASNSIESGNYGNLISKPVGTKYYDSFAFWLESGSLNGAVGSTANEGPYASYPFTLVPGVWYHAAYTFDSDSQTQTIYVNGVVVASGPANLQIGYDSHPVLFGCDNDYGSFDQPFNGRIDEVSIYNRALTSNEIAGIYAAGSAGKCDVPAGTVLVLPQSQSVAAGGTATFSAAAGGTPPFAYQWSFDGTNISGGTDSILVLTNVNSTEAGSYTVTASNFLGSATSSNAILAVGNPPSVTVSPLTQAVVQGTNVTFTASATGTGPLSIQWSLNGAVLDGATNSVLNLVNVQPASAGSYTVTVSSPFGTAVSSNAVLSVALLPVIASQPQSQVVVVGNSVTFSVANSLSVNSGTLQLWLKADAGAVTNATGQVSSWQDQSGNTNDASQANTNLLPLLVHPAGLGGQAAVRFNGIQDGIHGNYLSSAGYVDVPDAMTAFTVYNFFSDTNRASLAWLIGVSGVFGGDRILATLNQELDFDTYAYDYQIPGPFPTNTYRICTDRVNTNLTTVDIFDTSATGGTNISLPMSNTGPPASGYYVGGVDPAAQGAYPGENLDGDVAEIMIYSGYLTDADRLAVFGYLQQKYFQTGGANGVTYQWQFDGTNIAGATNATLTLADVQSTNAGTYTVIVTDAAGSTTSSNAVLTPLFPATITSSPASQSVSAGTTVTFNAGATGTAPLTYQWQFDGTNIAGATNTSLTIANAVVANAGSYAMVAVNPYGSSTSLVASLVVDESTITVSSASANGGGTALVSIDLIALGTESGVGFSLDFDTNVLTFVSASLGSGAAGSGWEVNTNQVGSGRLGFGAAFASGTFSAGTNDLLDVTFQVAVVTNETTSILTFGSQPANELVSDPLAQTLPSVFLPGTVVIPPTVLAGDVSPRPNGNEAVNIEDWIQEGRFVAGLDIVSNGSEFQRADCAPRSTQGDGQITVADWVQVGRYAVGLDPLTVAGGPTSPQPQVSVSPHFPGKDDVSPSLTLIPLSQGAEKNSVAVELAAQGNVNSLGFSVTFNPAMIRFVGASIGGGATGATWVQNTNQAAAGNVGFLMGYLAPATFATGAQQLVVLNFAPVSYSNTTALAFSDTPIATQAVDASTTILTTTVANATLAVGGLSWPPLSISQSGNNVVLSWPSSASNMSLQVSSSLDGVWSDVDATPTAVGDNLVLTAPVSTNTVFYRLKY